MNKMVWSIGLVMVMAVSGIAAEPMKGAGATFPAILINKMVDRYQHETGVVVTYSAIGSFVGLNELETGRVAFAISDVQLLDSEIKTPEMYVDVPVALGALALIYNLPGVSLLKLNADLIGGILAGKITRWDDARIQGINPKATLPKLPIKLISRADRSGTTFLLNQYLTAVGQAVNGQIGKAVTGNQGVIDAVGSTVGAFGYTEMHYALGNNLSVAAIQNSRSQFVMPSVESILAAFEDVSVDNIMRAGINSNADFAYPIVGFSWISVQRDQSKVRSYKASRNLVDLVWWMTHQGQLYAEENGFAPLPPSAMKFASQRLKYIRFDDVIIR
jgi:phosphate transport system substrate-binding protein